MQLNRTEEAQLIEDVEVLGGKRSRQRRRSAVRIEDLDGVLQINNRLQAAKAAGAAPTKAEFDALVDDMSRVHTALVAVMGALQKKLLP